MDGKELEEIINKKKRELKKDGKVYLEIGLMTGVHVRGIVERESDEDALFLRTKEGSRVFCPDNVEKIFKIEEKKK